MGFGSAGIAGLIVSAWAMAASLAACSPQSAAEATPSAEVAEAAVHPVSGLAIVPLTVTADGKTHEFRVEMAEDEEAQRKGLMFRTELGPYEGMIFPSDSPSARSFWMKNTPLPLDIIFVGTDGRILNIARGEPYTLDPVYSVGTASGVLELRAGRAAELGIEPGDLVEW